MDKGTVDKMVELVRFADFDLRRTQEKFGKHSVASKDALRQFGTVWQTLRTLRSADEFLAEVV